MNYKPGTPINLVERFYLIDPLTEIPTLADPGTVTFHVESPDGTVVDYVYGTDTNVTHPSTGVYVCEVGPFTGGTFVYNAEGTSPVIAQSGDKTFVVTDSAFDPSESDIPTAGPCQPWIAGDDIEACGDSLGVGSDTWLLDSAAIDASLIMFEVSGRQFPGVCRRTVRPCSSGCGCWGDVSSGAGPWVWSSFYGGVSWGWFNDQGGQCGCDKLSEVRLAGYPVRGIAEVKINGVVLPEVDDNGDRNWRLDRNRRLVRMDSPVDGKRYWPGCQNLALDDTEDGTFSVSYTWGMEPPSLAKAAAAVMGRELFKACQGDSGCKLPSKVSKIARQGITIERVVAVADLLRAGSTGLQIVDTFIATHNPTKARRRPAVMSPDVQRYARKVG